MKELEQTFDKRELTLLSPGGEVLNHVAEAIEVKEISSQ